MPRSYSAAASSSMADEAAGSMHQPLASLPQARARDQDREKVPKATPEQYWSSKDPSDIFSQFSQSATSSSPEEEERRNSAFKDYDASCSATLADDGVYLLTRSRAMESTWSWRANLTIETVVKKPRAVLKQLLGGNIEPAEVVPFIRKVSDSKLEVGFTQQEHII